MSGSSDTVYLGAFRTDQLRSLKGWDERLPTNQDFDLNRRMAALGTIWFEAGLRSRYIPRPSLRQLQQQYFRFGRWKVRYWRLTGDRPEPRQLAAMLGVPIGALAVAGGARANRRRMILPLAALVAVDARGARGGGGGPLVRGMAMVTVCVVAISWSAGVWGELIAGAWRRDGQSFGARPSTG